MGEISDSIIEKMEAGIYHSGNVYSKKGEKTMEKIITPEFRVSYPSVFRPCYFENSKPVYPGKDSHMYRDKNTKYRLTLIFDREKDLSELVTLVNSAVEKKWPDKAQRPSIILSPFRDSSEKGGKKGYENCVFVSATKLTDRGAPGLVDENRQEIIDPKEFYAGCYARASVTAFGWSYAGKNGVSFGLQNIQKIKDGEPFGDDSTAEEDFDPAAVQGRSPMFD